MQGLCFLLLSLLSIQFIHCNKDDVSTVDGKKSRRLSISVAEDEELDQRSPAKILCTKPGCKCNVEDQDRATEAMCDCLSQEALETKITLSSSLKYPPNLKILRVSHCDFVDLGSSRKGNELFKLNLSLLLIESVQSVVFYPSTLKRVANLTVKDVSHFLFDKSLEDHQAFDDLDADNVKFTNVSFSPDELYMGDFRPARISNRLEFDSCTMSNKMPIIFRQQDDTVGLTVRLRKCRIDSMTASVKADRIEMIGNQFQSNICKDCESSGAYKTIEIEYKYLNMSGNTFRNRSVPDMRQSVDPSDLNGIEFDYSKQTDMQAGEMLMKFFELKPINPITNRAISPCKENPSWAPNVQQVRVLCPNVEKMLEYLQLKSKTQTSSSSSPTNHYKSITLFIFNQLFTISGLLSIYLFNV